MNVSFSFELRFCEPKSQTLANCTNHLADFPHTNNHFPYSTHILLIHTQTPCVLMIRMYVEECSYIRFILHKLFFFVFVHFNFVSLSFVNGWLAGWRADCNALDTWTNTIQYTYICVFICFVVCFIFFCLLFSFIGVSSGYICAIFIFIHRHEKLFETSTDTTTTSKQKEQQQ